MKKEVKRWRCRKKDEEEVMKGRDGQKVEKKGRGGQMKEERR